jgi:hypothetical protein
MMAHQIEPLDEKRIYSLTQGKTAKEMLKSLEKLLSSSTKNLPPFDSYDRTNDYIMNYLDTTPLVKQET